MALIKKYDKHIGRLFYYLRIYGVIAAPFILLLLPADLFDIGESLCIFKKITGTECYACGLTRGVMHFIHFDFQKAWEFNKLTFIVVPALFPLWLKAVYESIGKKLPGLLGRLT